MKSPTRAALALAFIIGTSFALTAQDKPSKPLLPPNITAVRPAAVEKGDQSIGLRVSLDAPLFILDGSLAKDGSTSNTNVGAAFGVIYQYYLSHGLSIGGDLSAAFNSTVGGRNLVTAPLAFRVAYTWILDSFELSAGAEAGAFLLVYNSAGTSTSHSTLGPMAKVLGSASWRIANAWSIGLEASYLLTAELHSAAYADLTRIGNTLDIGIIANYHL